MTTQLALPAACRGHHVVSAGTVRSLQPRVSGEAAGQVSVGLGSHPRALPGGPAPELTGVFVAGCGWTQGLASSRKELFLSVGSGSRQCLLSFAGLTSAGALMESEESKCRELCWRRRLLGFDLGASRTVTDLPHLAHFMVLLTPASSRIHSAGFIAPVF